MKRTEVAQAYLVTGRATACVAGLLVLLALTTLGPVVRAAPPAATTQPAVDVAVPRCPVTQLPIDRSIALEFRGKPLYFATAAAREKFRAAPYDYREAILAQWEALRPVRLQVRCPVTGGPVDPEIKLETADEAVLFATTAARAEYREHPERYRDQLAECYTFQTQCPCGVGAARPGVSLKTGKRQLYFCCPGCRAAFEQRPTMYLSKLDEHIAANEARWRAKQGAATTQPATDED